MTPRDANAPPGGLGMKTIFAILVAATLGSQSTPVVASSSSSLGADIDRAAAAVTEKVVAWRRDIHQNPELGNREVRTAEKVAAHLKALGLDVRTGVAKHGVIGVLKGGRPGPVVALRADMDALPVTEESTLPFASRARGEYAGREVGVMHACGHDAHVAILMGVAEVLASLRDRLPGTIVFLFQPAEEGPPEGEEGGASLMVREGCLKDPAPSAIFGLHVRPNTEVGTLAWRAGGLLASTDVLKILVKGRQTHASQPWNGVDPITVAAQIIVGLQMIEARQIEITKAPALVSIGSIHGGLRNNIIPEEVEMVGTVRALDTAMQHDIHQRIKKTAESIAAASGATAIVTITEGNPVTANNPALTARMAPTLARVAGKGKTFPEYPPILGGEDFAEYQKVIPGLFFFLGVRTPGDDPGAWAPNHSPRFRIDEAALPLGVRALAHLAVDYLSGE